MSSPETIPPAVPDLPALARVVTWEHYGRRTHTTGFSGYQATCGCGWESASTAQRDEADAEHSSHLADEVRAALLSAHRDMLAAQLREVASARREYLTNAPTDAAKLLENEVAVLDCAARIVEGDLGPLYGLMPSWRWTDEMDARLRERAATAPQTGPASMEPAENGPAVGREATEAQGGAEGDLIDRDTAWRAIDYWMARTESAEAERDRVAEAAGQLHLKWLAEVADLKQRILDIDAHATPYGDIPDEPGWVGTYLVTAGALHRALGQVGHSAPKCQAEAERDRLEAERDEARAKRDRLAEVIRQVREQATDPALIRWCGWPGCLQSFAAWKGPLELGWVLAPTPGRTLLCPGHAAAGHIPGFEVRTTEGWSMAATCSCGERAQPDPANGKGASEWWSEHVAALGDAAKPAPCCDMHGRDCEPPSELCCPDCTEAAHDTFPIRHADGSTCSAPDLSGTQPEPEPARAGRFEELLAAEHEQFDRRGELLRSIVEYHDAPSTTVAAPGDAGADPDGEQKSAQLPAGEDIRTVAGHPYSEMDALDGAMHSVWLHGNWRWLTKQMTTEQKEATLAAVLRHGRAIDDDEDHRLNAADWAWWRNPEPAGPGVETGEPNA